MAVFTPESAGSLTDLTDLKKVQDYLYRMNEQLQYMFRNLTPEDNNAASAPSLSYTTGENVKIIVDGNEMDIVLENEVIKAINISTEHAKIVADKISINGIASGGNKFVINDQGVPILTDATINTPAVSGGTINNAAISNSTITGATQSGGTVDSAAITNGTIDGAAIFNGTIIGADISGGTVDGADITNGTIDDAAITDGTMSGTAISDATATDTALQTGAVGPFTVAQTGISNTDMSIANDGTAELAELTLADSFWNGQTVTQVVKTIWDAVFPSTP